MDNFENISMFDQEHEDGLIRLEKTNTIDVVKMEYVSAETTTWQELFSGFNKLKVITFSSGINFVYNLLSFFDDAEIIFGCEDTISFAFHEIIAYQDKLIERLRVKNESSKGKLLSRIDDGSVRIYVAKKKLSHEKIYLLEANDGRKRVIMGSANMSYNAFSGKQRENICYIDGERAFDWYLGIFDDLKGDSSNELTKHSFIMANADENIDLLPIAEEIKTKRVIVIERDDSPETKTEIEFILSTKGLAKNLAPIVPKPDKKIKRLEIDSDAIIKLKRHIEKAKVQEKEHSAEYPALIVDAMNYKVSLNGVSLDLSPSKEEICNDVTQFIKYMDGYSNFHGDNIGMQYRYYEFANWFFCSPFMPIMRDMATRYDQNKLPYPVFGLLYGQSKAGKTSFLETLLLMMIGQKPKMAAPEFTRTSIESLKYTVKGAPIIVDDLTNARFNAHAIETIKNDDFGIVDHLQNYPSIVISANEDVKAVAPEVVRRTVICRVEAGLTNTEVMKSNIVKSVRSKMGTAFYREYLRRMLDIIPDLIEQLKDDDNESAPDILKVSSEVLFTIINEHCVKTPDYIRSLSLDDYFGEQVVGKYARKTINTAWRTNKKAFAISEKNNELRYNAGQTYDAGRLIKELPETLEARVNREFIIMNLAEAKEFFGINFKKHFWQ